MFRTTERFEPLSFEATGPIIPRRFSLVRGFAVKQFAVRVVAVIAALNFSTQVHAGSLGSWQLSGWSLEAATDDETGKFSFCSAETRYNSGIGLMFTIHADGKWAMSFMHASWHLKLKDVYPLQYRIDRGPMLNAQGIAITTNLVLVPLEDSTVLFEMFRRGQVLNVFAAGQIFGFNLTSTSKVLDATAACFRQQIARGPSADPSNPFVPAPTARPHPRANGDYKAEAATLLANVLSASGVQGFSIADTVPEGFENFLAVWTAPGLFGGVQIVDNASVEQTATSLVASDTGTCTGTLGAAKLPPTPSGAARVRTVCEETSGKSGFRINYVIIPRAKGGVYILSTAEMGEPAPQASERPKAEEAAARMFDASIKVLEPR